MTTEPTYTLANRPLSRQRSRATASLRAGRSAAYSAIAAALALAGLGTACGPRAPRTDEEKLVRLAGMIADIDRRFPDVETVTVEQVGRWLEADSVVLVDVREPRERAVSMIPGAVGLEEYERDPDRFGDRAVIAYCTIGHRSAEYARRLTAAGRRVLNLRGGLLAWVHAGGPVVRDGASTRELHVYGRKWDLAPTGWRTVW